MTDSNKTLIVALVDRTGSMLTIKSDAEGAFNSFIQTLRAETDDIGDQPFVTLYQFDWFGRDHDVTELIYANMPLEQVPGLSIEPRGNTPLNDALALTIIRTGEQLAKLNEEQRPGKVIFVVVTDGLENYSQEYRGSEGAARVREMITRQTDEWKWDFHFLGVGIDAWATSSRYGFTAVNTVQSDRTEAGLRSSYGAMGMSVNSSRRDRSSRRVP